MGMMGGCPMMGPNGQASTFIDGRIAFLKAELAITDAQKSAWDAYADATKRNLQSMQGMWQTMKTVFDGKPRSNGSMRTLRPWRAAATR